MSRTQKHISDLKILFKSLEELHKNPKHHLENSSQSFSRKMRSAMDNVFRRINGKLTIIDYENKSRSTPRARSATKSNNGNNKRNTLKNHSY